MKAGWLCVRVRNCMQAGADLPASPQPTAYDAHGGTCTASFVPRELVNERRRGKHTFAACCCHAMHREPFHDTRLRMHDANSVLHAYGQNGTSFLQSYAAICSFKREQTCHTPHHRYYIRTLVVVHRAALLRVCFCGVLPQSINHCQRTRAYCS